MSDQPNLRVKASPTKELFIYMLTKDLVLVDAIADLVDNCVDGAKRLRHSEDYTDLFVHLEVTSQIFRITDNCGGMDVKTAREYAFCFGRPLGMPPTDHSIGNFGVGMKRALFKLGRFFSVESHTKSSSFVLEQNIEDWASVSDWDFYFKDVKENLEVRNTSVGTTIAVSNLYTGVSDEFSLDNFLIRLREKLESVHQISMEKGLKIKLNNTRLEFLAPSLIASDLISPAFEEKEFVSEDLKKVSVKIYAGLSVPEPSKAGWNIYCNDRLILESNTDFITGWGIKLHNDYARFRGFVFFDSLQSDLLPWNTTKNYIDSDLPLYRSVREDMITVMKPVTDFLRRVARDKRNQENDDPSPLELAIHNAKSLPLKNFTTRQSFVSPSETPPMQTASLSTIKYQKPLDEVEQVKMVLDVRTLKEVGEKTFEYFMRMECSD
jgi:hypothetical protein